AWGLPCSANAVRLRERDEIMRVLTVRISNLKRSELIAALDEADVPVGPVNDVAEILADPHVRARGLVSSFDYPGVGEFRALGLPYKFLGWDDPAVGRPPALGEHTDAVLKEMLHFSESEIRELRKAKAI